MKMKSHAEGPPCKEMENLLQGVADGSVGGIRKWFVMFHVSHCSHCGNFYKRLQAMLSMMHDQRSATPPEDVMERLRAKIRDLDQDSAHES